MRKGNPYEIEGCISAVSGAVVLGVRATVNSDTREIGEKLELTFDIAI